MAVSWIIQRCRPLSQSGWWCVVKPKLAPISLVMQTFEHIPFLKSQQQWGETLQPWMWPKNQKAHISKAVIRMTSFTVCFCVCASTSHNHCVKGKWLVLTLPGEIPQSDYIQINFHVGLGAVERCYVFIIARAQVYTEPHMQYSVYRHKHTNVHNKWNGLLLPWRPLSHLFVRCVSLKTVICLTSSSKKNQWAKWTGLSQTEHLLLCLIDIHIHLHRTYCVTYSKYKQKWIL